MGYSVNRDEVLETNSYIQYTPLNWDTFVSGHLSQLTEKFLVLASMEKIFFLGSCPD